MTGIRPKTIIRQFTKEDRSAVRDIAYRTACRCRGEFIFPGLAEPIADYLTRYYTDYEPDNAWVLEQAGRVTGYLLGCSDTSRQIRLMSRRIIPRILYAIPWYLLKSNTTEITRRIVKWSLIHAWREIPSVPLREFPAHLHFNLLPGSYGLMYTSKMTMMFLDRLTELGVPGVHFAVTERKYRGAHQGMVDRFIRNHPGMRPYYSERPSSFNRVVFGNTDLMVNRIWGFPVRDLNIGVNLMASLFRL